MSADVHDFIDPAENCPWRSPRAIFAERGYQPIPPSDVDDRQLPGRLWELLYAAAARRLFFHYTNHLSDRDLYELLWQQRLDTPTADIPLEAETNTHTDLSGFNANGMNHEEIYLRFYADEGSLEFFRRDEPGFVAPPHEEPPYDRDRFLPVPPFLPEAHAGWQPGGDEPPVEQECRQDRIAGIEDGMDAPESEAQPGAFVSDESESGLEAELEAMEPENWVPPAETLGKQEVPLLPPAEITAETLTPILWELLHNLALRGFYILHTDHLSDSELYAELWHHGLREPACLPGRNPHGGWFHDFLGSWGDEEMQLWLRFYATDEERAQHAADWPNDAIPAKEKPPFNRDWRLPKGPF